MTATRHHSSPLSTAILTAGVVVVGAQAFVLAPLLPDVAAGLGTGVTEAGRALATYGIGIVVSALLAGQRLDTAPRRTVLLAGMAALVAAAAGSALASHWMVLALAQFVGGAGVGVVLPATYALAAELAAPGAAARATGRVLTGWSIALVAGVPLATVLGDAVGWRTAFWGLAGLCALQVGLIALLPVLPVTEPGRAALGRALRVPGVRPLLAAVFMFMAAFYGVFAFVGAEVREVHGGGATTGGLVALSYGIGFGAAVAADRLLDRVGPARLVAPTLAVLAAVYLTLALTIGSFSVFLAVALLWGLVNHVGLTLLVSRLSGAAPDLRGSVLSLNTAATYAGAALAGALAGPLYVGAGFGALATTAAVLMVLAVLAALNR